MSLYRVWVELPKGRMEGDFVHEWDDAAHHAAVVARSIADRGTLPNGDGEVVGVKRMSNSEWEIRLNGVPGGRAYVRFRQIEE